MADTKISDLTAATTTDGSEVLPVVQSATTKKMTVDVIKDFVLSDPAVVSGFSGYASALCGDSFTAYSFFDSATITSNQNTGWWHHMNIASGGSFRMLSNLSIGGATLGPSSSTSLILDQVQAAVLLKPSVIFINGGTNDIVAHSKTDVETIDFAKTVIAEALKSGAIVVFSTITPRSDSAATAVMRQYILNFNVWLKNYVNSVRGLVVVDDAASTIDPLSTTLAPLASMVQSDGTHPTNAAAGKIGLSRWNQLKYLFPARSLLINSAYDRLTTNAASKNALQQPMFLGAGGSKLASGGGSLPTGTVPNNWVVDYEIGTTAGIGIACTVPARSDGLGNDLQVVITGTSAADKITIKCSTEHAVINAAGWSKIYAEIQAIISNAVNLKEAYLAITAQNSGNVFAYDGRQQSFNSVNYTVPNVGGIYTTRDLDIAAGAQTNCYVSFVLVFGGVGGAQVNLSRASLRKAQ